MVGYTRMGVAYTLLLITFVGLLAVTRYFDLSTAAEQSGEAGVVSAVRQNLTQVRDIAALSKGKTKFPLTLDDARLGQADKTNRFFGHIIEHGVAVEDWKKTGRFDYISPSGREYSYDPTSGRFQSE